MIQPKQLPAEAFDLGTWVGRKQAFHLIAGKCSAADAECLRHIRDNKLYRALDLNWEQFCRDYAGISRAFADKTIRELEEFGPLYFRLAGVTRINPEDYRRIAASVTEQGVSCDGTTIPIEPENAPRLARAIDALRGRAAHPASIMESADDALARVRKRLDAAVAELERWSARNLDPDRRIFLQSAAGAARDRLTRLLR